MSRICAFVKRRGKRQLLPSQVYLRETISETRSQNHSSQLLLNTLILKGYYDNQLNYRQGKILKGFLNHHQNIKLHSLLRHFGVQMGLA